MRAVGALPAPSAAQAAPARKQDPQPEQHGPSSTPTVTPVATDVRRAT